MGAWLLLLVEDSYRSIGAEMRQVAFSDRAFQREEQTSPTLVIEKLTSVGSGRVFMHFSSNYRTFVLEHSDFSLSNLFSLRC
jgi:hypothetical protein